MSISNPRASQPRVRKRCSIMRAVAAADIQNARAGLDQAGDQTKIDPHLLGDTRVLRHSRTETRPACDENPARRAETHHARDRYRFRQSLRSRAARFSARAMLRDCGVGNSQSEVNETRQNRVFVPANAAERDRHHARRPDRTNPSPVSPSDKSSHRSGGQNCCPGGADSSPPRTLRQRNWPLPHPCRRCGSFGRICGVSASSDK